MSGSALKLLALVLLCTLSPTATAQWSRVGALESLTLYQDHSTIERVGSLRRVVEMQDLSRHDPDGVLSRRYLNEYDCATAMHRIGRMASFAGPRLSGKQLFDIDETGYWRRIPPDSLFAAGFRRMCANWVEP